MTFYCSALIYKGLYFINTRTTWYIVSFSYDPHTKMTLFIILHAVVWFYMLDWFICGINKNWSLGLILISFSKFFYFFMQSFVLQLSRNRFFVIGVWLELWLRRLLWRLFYFELKVLANFELCLYCYWFWLLGNFCLGKKEIWKIRHFLCFFFFPFLITRIILFSFQTHQVWNPQTSDFNYWHFVNYESWHSW